MEPIEKTPAMKEAEQEWIDNSFALGNKFYEIKITEKAYRKKLEELQAELDDMIKKSEKINAKAMYLRGQAKPEEKANEQGTEATGTIGQSGSSEEAVQPQVSS